MARNTAHGVPRASGLRSGNPATITGLRAVAITAAVCATPIISHSIGRSVYGLLLPAIRSDLNLTNSQAGWPSSGTFLMYVLGVLAVVVLSPRLEPIAIMRAALALSLIGVAIAATAPGLVSLVVGVSLVGGAGAGIWMTAPVLATEYVSAQRRGLIIGALTSTIGLANIVFGVGTSLWRRAADDEQLWRPIWWVSFGLIALLLTAMVAIARFRPTDRIATSGIDLSIIRRLPLWAEITVAYALFGGMSAGFGTFIVAALEDHGNIASSTSPLIFSAMGVAGMVSAPIAGAISDRAGRLVVMRSVLLVLFVANVLVAMGGAVPVVAGALTYSAGAAAFPALIATYVRDHLDSRAFSQALAIMTILFSLMAAASPAIVGRLADVSFRWSYMALAALPLAAFVLLVATGARTSPEPGARTVAV